MESTHKLIHINNILVNPENPRHNPVLDLGEEFVMKQLITNKREANAMYKLMTDIFKDGWYPSSIVTVTYEVSKKKYIAWDGNRRVTALKILQRPQLADTFEAFSYNQKRGIYNISKAIEDESFFEVFCYVSPTFEDCAGYIRSIHTNDSGALRWDTASIKRFEERLGIKNIFTQLQGYCPKAFSTVNRSFPVSKFEKIVNSKIGKEYLQIEFIDNTLTCLSSVEELEKKVSKIINDINEKVITNETVKNIKNIRKYLYPNNNEIKLENINNEKEYKEKLKIDTLIDEKDEENTQIGLFDGSLPIKNKTKEENKTKSIKNKTKLIRRNQDIKFRYLDISNLKSSNQRAKGIKNIVYELQRMSTYNQYRYYPSAYCFLIRSILEQSSIYFLINMSKWEKLREGNNDKDLRLEQIINYVSRNKGNLIADDTILKCWETCFDSLGTKNYLDLVIHHPEQVTANIEAIRNITDIGMYAIIQYFLNS